MLLSSFVFGLLGSPILALAAATVTLETVSAPPQGWSLLKDARENDSITLFVALKQPRMDALKSKLTQLDHLQPRGKGRHRHHLSRQQVHDYGKADRTSADLVLAWLRSHGVKQAKQFDSWVSFEVTAREVRSLLGAHLHWYSYKHDKPVLRTREYRIPAWLRGHVDFIHPLTHFMPPRHWHVHPQPQPEPTNTTEAPTPEETTIPDDDFVPVNINDIPCATGVFPECIKKLYNITYEADFPSPSRFGVAGFLDQYINYADVSNFLDVYVPELADLDPAYNFTVELLNNGTNPQDPLWMAGMEASLDVEYAMGVGYPAAVTYYSTGGRGVKLDGSGSEIPTTGSDNEPYLEMLEALLAKPDEELPHVLSISYADDEQSVPRAYALRVCDLFAQLAARGVSVLAASGDGGSAGTGQNYCYTNDEAQQKMLIPTFPASCPWVTSIGATKNDGYTPTAAPFSAGGFSRYFERPSWQDSAVQPYLEGLLTAVADGTSKLGGQFNESGRAIPDISAVGSAFQIWYGGGSSAVLGTSASTPVLAAMIALINDARLRAGKDSLGWLNPLLYSDSVRETLTDITKGQSQGCSFGEGEEDGEGWTAGPGYDCVTGLGVPGDFSKLLAVLA